MRFNPVNEHKLRATRTFLRAFPREQAVVDHDPVVTAMSREFVTAALFTAVTAGIFTARRQGRSVKLGSDGTGFLPPPPNAFLAALPACNGPGVTAALVDGMLSFHQRAAFAGRIARPLLAGPAPAPHATTEIHALHELWLSLCSEALLVFHRMCDQSGLDLESLSRDIDLVRFAVREIGDGRPYFVREDGTIFIPGWLELRRAERLAVAWSVTVRQNGRGQAAILNNISRTGAGLTFMPPLESGTPIGLELESGRVLHGMIVWNSQMHHGVEFFDPLAEHDPILQPEPAQDHAILD